MGTFLKHLSLVFLVSLTSVALFFQCSTNSDSKEPVQDGGTVKEAVVQEGTAEKRNTAEDDEPQTPESVIEKPDVAVDTEGVSESQKEPSKEDAQEANVPDVSVQEEAPERCSPECQMNQTRCSQSTHYQTCVKDGSGCFVWSTRQACGKGTSCRKSLQRCTFCNPGESQSCYSGDAKTKNVGLCKEGQKKCLNDGSKFGVCVGEVKPAQEVCDGTDNNCNGQVDDGIKPRTCKTGKPGACANGSEVCVQGKLSCKAPTPAAKETCNDKIDNNCNGQVDENCNQGQCPQGKTFCLQSFRCEDLMTSRGNCGKCGNYCGQDATCCGGVCCMTLMTPRFFACCSNRCVSLSTNQNCGSCGKTCTSGKSCYGAPGLYCK